MTAAYILEDYLPLAEIVHIQANQAANQSYLFWAMPRPVEYQLQL